MSHLSLTLYAKVLRSAPKAYPNLYGSAPIVLNLTFAVNLYACLLKEDSRVVVYKYQDIS